MDDRQVDKPLWKRYVEDAAARVARALEEAARSREKRHCRPVNCHYVDIMTSLAAARHPRCGAHSPLRVLPSEVIGRIFSFTPIVTRDRYLDFKKVPSATSAPRTSIYAMTLHVGRKHRGTIEMAGCNYSAIRLHHYISFRRSECALLALIPLMAVGDGDEATTSFLLPTVNPSRIAYPTPSVETIRRYRGVLKRVAGDARMSLRVDRRYMMTEVKVICNYTSDSMGTRSRIAFHNRIVSPTVIAPYTLTTVAGAHNEKRAFASLDALHTHFLEAALRLSNRGDAVADAPVEEIALGGLPPAASAGGPRLTLAAYLLQRLGIQTSTQLADRLVCLLVPTREETLCRAVTSLLDHHRQLEDFPDEVPRRLAMDLIAQILLDEATE